MGARALDFPWEFHNERREGCSLLPARGGTGHLKDFMQLSHPVGPLHGKDWSPDDAYWLNHTLTGLHSYGYSLLSDETQTSGWDAKDRPGDHLGFFSSLGGCTEKLLFLPFHYYFFV